MYDISKEISLLKYHIYVQSYRKWNSDVLDSMHVVVVPAALTIIDQTPEDLIHVVDNVIEISIV